MHFLCDNEDLGCRDHSLASEPHASIQNVALYAACRIPRFFQVLSAKPDEFDVWSRLVVKY
jgi:hypothetical protein